MPPTSNDTNPSFTSFFTRRGGKEHQDTISHGSNVKKHAASQDPILNNAFIQGPLRSPKATGPLGHEPLGPTLPTNTTSPSEMTGSSKKDGDTLGPSGLGKEASKVPPTTLDSPFGTLRLSESGDGGEEDGETGRQRGSSSFTRHLNGTQGTHDPISPPGTSVHTVSLPSNGPYYVGAFALFFIVAITALTSLWIFRKRPYQTKDQEGQEEGQEVGISMGMGMDRVESVLARPSRDMQSPLSAFPSIPSTPTTSDPSLPMLAHPHSPQNSLSPLQSPPPLSALTLHH
ncbi:MAG: hypothetical protein DHS80DRAFT_30450 [Piptocephalis tieghemiana]|nr:MAG: hypothetical protein DHS80DRAFT_30450 [Piptocephalis tieghemiana]